MPAPHVTLKRLRRFNASINRDDREMVRENVAAPRSEVFEGGVAMAEAPVDDPVLLESIILRTSRPVLQIAQGTTKLIFENAEDRLLWESRLTNAQAAIDLAIPAVGRIELQGGALDWVGTGWLVHESILVTNRHVANEFAMRKGEGFDFRPGADGRIAASVDFLEEIDNTAERVFKLKRPLHVEGDSGLDVAFFEVDVKSGHGKLAGVIPLARSPRATEDVATIGYPAFDSRIPDFELMERLYGSIYNKKRLAPGAVTKVEPNRLLHNCTTLGGNSGSVVFDFKTGEAVGLHFSGTFLTTNYAVRADLVKRLLATVRARKVRPESARNDGPPPPPPPQPPRPVVAHGGRLDGSGTSFTIPLTVTVSLGDAALTARPGGAVLPAAPALPATTALVKPVRFSTAPYDDAIVAVDGAETRAADLADRKGYQPNFLGTSKKVPLPTVDRDEEDVLEFEVEGETETELRYEHFSVVMSRSRRMCFLSATNIDGKLSKKSKRVQWKLDGRIPTDQQIIKECYGDPPRFSRGHMTRREDPGWGTPTVAKRGNEDSMHVTNATPQMQAFNSPIWLALEDYALGHAREDDMKISVFTGPFFTDDDPEMFGVRIPLSFWKIIAFVHDETGKLCATGYEMNQENNLQPEEEFVFGQFTSPQLGITTQLPISDIARRTGISFGNLAAVDPLATADEGVDESGQRAALAALEQIRFVK